jgi:SAM-dependent methyltransferase
VVIIPAGLGKRRRTADLSYNRARVVPVSSALMLPASSFVPATQPVLDAKEAAKQVMFDQMWTRLRSDPLLDELNVQAYGADYPYDVKFFSSCTRTTLDLTLAGLQLTPSSVLIDLGYGLGGPGQWIARESGAQLVGIDLSQAAVDAATTAAASYLQPGQFDYRCGTITATGLPDSSADGLMSIDALAMAADRVAALKEVRRILRPGARAVFTCAEWRGDAPLIADAGLLLVDEFIDNGKQARQLRLYKLWLEHQTELEQRFGPPGQSLIEEARMGPGQLTPNYRGLLLTVERPNIDQ